MTKAILARPLVPFSDTPSRGSDISPAYRGARSRQTILIVDDDQNLRMLLEYVLRKHYQVVTREDGLSAMAWMSSGHIPDLIISDVDMPHLNGYEFLLQLRASGYFRNIPVVMLSGYNDGEVVTRCTDSGAVGFLYKPFNPDEVLKTIQVHLSHTAISSDTRS